MLANFTHTCLQALGLQTSIVISEIKLWEYYLQSFNGLRISASDAHVKNPQVLITCILNLQNTPSLEGWFYFQMANYTTSKNESDQIATLLATGAKSDSEDKQATLPNLIRGSLNS